MPARPSLVDNAETSHADALAFLIGDHPVQYGLSVATGYVNLGGLHHLAVCVTDRRGVRLLLGAVPAPGLGAAPALPHFERALEGLRKDRDLARFPPSRAAQLANLDGWLGRPEVQVRRFVERFLHGKAYLFGDSDDARAALVTSANLTNAGLSHNLELGLAHYDPMVAGAAVGWFDKLWNQADEFKADLQELLFPNAGLIDPQTVYLRALLELFDEETVPVPPLSTVNLAPFQEDGFRRALEIVRRRHGVVYADGVGTGKTEIGLAFIEEYTRRRGSHALVVAPRQLVQHWQERIERALLPARVVTYHELATDEQLTPVGTTNRARRLTINKDVYRLVVVDEGHALRTPDTTWQRAMARLLGGERKDLVLLTATPINNGLWDLYHLVMTFALHDRAFAADGIPSLRRLFVTAGANERDPENLDPDVLFPLADMVSVRRDRRFIETRYPDAVFPDGTPVRFPTPVLTTERYDLDEAHPDLVLEVVVAIGDLTMARYRPSAYRIGDTAEVHEDTLSALLQSAILKRFESCWQACLLTLERMLGAHDAFLAAWDEGHVLHGDALQTAATLELDETGIAQWLVDNPDEEGVEPVNSFRAAFRNDVSRDREALARLVTLLSRLDPGHDPKLGLLRSVIETSPSQKVIVFSTFADTVRYLDDNLPTRLGGRQRVTVIGAETDPDQRTELLARFCPKTVVRPDYEPEDGEVDLLLSNDVLSEGQNLQQAAAVISYDMPWNPQRVVQRYGRVIRLKSEHKQVHLTTMLPEPGDLEEMLKLEAAIRRKVKAARTFGMEIQVIKEEEGEEEREIRSYARRLTDGDPSLLNETGHDSTPQGLSPEQVRSQLRRAFEEGEAQRLRQLPWGIGAAFHQGNSIPSTGPPGVFFACRTTSDQKYWRYIETDNNEVESAPGAILRRINPGNAPNVDNPPIDLEAAWQTAVTSIVEEHNQRAASSGDPAPVGPIQRWALELLRNPAALLPEGAENAYQALSVDRSRTVRTALGAIRRDLNNEHINPTTAANRIVEVVQSYGLHEVEPPEALTPITQNDVGVVCWLAALPKEQP
ncbi:MAG: helicase-related protein [bacterium]|nr:helicase-related protein [bacterium]